MLTQEIFDIISSAADAGWVLEPEAKRLFAMGGLEIPNYRWALRVDEAIAFARETGYPVVAKIVSPRVVHKSEHGGVVVGIRTDEAVRAAFEKFSSVAGFAGMLVEEMVSGLELIVGAKMDEQFGPVILLGMGGTGVEIYKDATVRMAPLREQDVDSMMKGLQAHELLEGYRGAEPVNVSNLRLLLLTFSGIVMDLQDLVESIDLNPIKCSAVKCVIADARIMLRKTPLKNPA
jgi:acetate---CoA ligase (ADP-forming) subunit beta